MATVEELEKELNQLKLDFWNHMHMYMSAEKTDEQTSNPKFIARCPRCKSMKEPEKIEPFWTCPDCGRQYDEKDCCMLFEGKPMIMPRK